MTPPSSAASLAASRRAYAEELRYCAHIRSEVIVDALAMVPREKFLGPGPWRIKQFGRPAYWLTPDDDPRHLYHNVLVAIDHTRGLNNGQPELWAFLFDQLELAPGERVLHIGAGVGYYTAIAAELVGASGRVTAFEVDEALAARAKANLADRDNVEVRAGDGCAFDPGTADAIIVNAGCTHPLPHWLDALPDGGRLLVPLTVEWSGGYLLVTRVGDAFAARFVCYVAIFPATSVRDAEAEARLAKALQNGGYAAAADAVKSLRRDPHPADDSCWLHAPDFCLSRNVV